MRTALLIGSNGQVGSEISRIWPETPALRSIELVRLTHADLEITKPHAVEAAIAGSGADLIINTAGFLRVDECERDPVTACAVNALGVKYVAECAARHGCFVVQYSTDYVFDGQKTSPYTESDVTRPLNAYGVSKLMGELFLQYCLPEMHLLIRTSGVFGLAGSSSKGGNFVETMLRLARAGRALSVVDDQTFSPTYAPDLAHSTLELISHQVCGTVHVTNSSATTWYEFARAAFNAAGLEPELRPVTSSEYGAAARRPRYSVLDNARAARLGASNLRSWQEALAEYISSRRE